jgi:hypothetical protein
MKLDISKSVFSVVLAFLLTATIILSLELLSARANNIAVTTSIRESLRSGATVFPASYDRNLRTGIDTWTDCLVLSIATYGQKDLISALTRSTYFALRDELHPCTDLNAKLGGSPTQAQAKVVSDYWRYWWGSAALLNITIGLFGLTLPFYQATLKAITYASILLTVCTALIRYRRAAWPFLPVAVALTFGFAIPLFGQSIAYAPCLIIGMLFLSVYTAAGLDRAPLRWQFVYFFVAGGLGVYFGFLDVNLVAILICISLLRLLSTYASAPPPIAWPALLARLPITTAVVHVIAAYVAGAVSMLLFRIALRAILTRQDLFAVVSEWLEQLSGYTTTNLWHFWLSRHADNNVAASAPLTGKDPSAAIVPDWLANKLPNLEVATFPYIGGHATVFVYTLCGLIYVSIGMWLLWQLLWHRQKFEITLTDRLLPAFLISLIIPLWYSLFIVHTLIHPWMDERLLSVFFSLGPSIALIIIFNIPIRRVSS